MPQILVSMSRFAHVGPLLLLSLLALTACREALLRPEDLLLFGDVSVGPRHACGVTVDGTVYCWGNGALGELNQDRQSSRNPVPVVIPQAVRRVAAGYSHTCALLVDGSAYCWGWGILGQLGNGAPTASGPLQVSGGHTFAWLASGWYHTCGVAEQGRVFCWGLNATGQLGNNTTTDSASPVASNGPAGLRFGQVTAGGGHTCALTDAGLAYCWGENASGQLGTGNVQRSTTPALVVGGTLFTSISAGFDHTCGVTRDQHIYCWGDNTRGELGNGGLEREGLPGSTTPRPVLGDAARYVSVSTGYRTTCAVTTEKHGVCFGAGTDAQLGGGSLADTSLPQDVARVSGANGADILNFAAVVAGGITYSCGRTVFGGVYCWGRGLDGELGAGSMSLSPLPVRVERAR